MRKNLIRHSVGCICFAALVLANAPASLGQFMAEYSSARAAGLGNMGVTQIDGMSYRVNPASLALYAGPDEVTLSLAPYSWSNEYLGDFKSWSTGGALSIGQDRVGGEGGFSYGIGYWFNKQDLGRFMNTNAVGEVLGIYGPSRYSHNLTLAAAHRGKVRVGFGTNLKILHDEIIGFADGLYLASSFGVDFGLLVAFPILPHGTDLVVQPVSGWTITPAIAVTAHNLFAEFDYDGIPGKMKPLQDTRVGVSVELAEDDRGRREMSFCLVAEYEQQKWDGADGFHVMHYGGEIGLYELLFARYGRLKYEDAEESQETYGVTLSTAGLNNLLTRHGGNYQESPPEGWWYKVAFEFSYAKFADDGPTWFQGMNLYQANMVVSL